MIQLNLSKDQKEFIKGVLENEQIDARLEYEEEIERGKHGKAADQDRKYEEMEDIIEAVNASEVDEDQLATLFHKLDEEKNSVLRDYFKAVEEYRPLDLEICLRKHRYILYLMADLKASHIAYGTTVS